MEPARHSDRPNTLVTGGAGFLGRALVALLRDRGGHVVAPRSRELDVTSDAAGSWIRQLRPTTVFHLAAAQPGAGADALTAVNAEGARRVALAAYAVGARLVHVSTDVVLDGRAAPYLDDASPRPLTPYGASKAAGETAVRAACPGVLLIRTSLLWDRAEMDRSTASFADRLASGARCTLFSDEIRCPLDRRTLAAALVDLAGLDVAGTLNVAGSQALSRLAFGTRLLAHFDVAGRDRVEAARAADLEVAGGPPRPRDLTLDVSRAESLLGRSLPGVDAVLEQRS